MVEKEQVELWESSEYILYAGLQAKAMGQEFFAWHGGVGSSIVDLNPDLKVFTSPLGDGKEYVAVPAISPDWAFLHVGWADRYGNGQHPGARFGDRIMARAADRVALTVERLVPNARIRANPVMTSVPYADAVVVAPFGSHPYASHGFYAEDAEHIEAYLRATSGFRRGDRSGVVYALTVVRVPEPGIEAPYRIGYADFPGGLRVCGRFTGPDVAVGDPVEVVTMVIRRPPPGPLTGRAFRKVAAP
jgi:glutaconate CoA-transferase, subunit A